MTFELDHLFICTAAEAPAAEQLIQLGLREGSRNVHPGQGTANRRFFFANLMLELLWVHNPGEAQSDRTRPTHLWERWSGQGACPFGICLRPSHAPIAQPPFPSWNYHPVYLPDALAIPMGTNAEVVTEPLVFYLPWGQRPDRADLATRQPLNHTIPAHAVTRVALTQPQPQSLSPALQCVVDLGLITLQPGSHYAMTLEFDQAQAGQQHSFWPTLPLTLRW